MFDRRRFLQSTGAAAALGPVRSWGAEADGRIALVIGNSAYRDSPLANPVNDANAIAGVFDSAGLSTTVVRDASRAQMASIIEQFAAAALAARTRHVFFYYAGHGVQLEWRNYLLPVDARVETGAQIREQCIDLASVLAPMQRARGKTLIVILDACRNDPFGTAFRPAQRGLSQFDAPAGSLLAYSTSPGSVASDGEGKHGLYTENLVRELSVKGTRIEDAFKRVRLNVRLASRGAQVPWETTSLESDVFLFESAKAGEADLEKQLEEDIAAWNAVKGSRIADDWVAYLRRFPSGRFAEIAQLRLARLMAAAAEKPTLPKVATQDDYDALPQGAAYVDPNGVERRKSR